jgi:uncharacterized protein (DUF1015 family)
VPEIVPFRAMRYNPQEFGQDWSDLIAPPYDVIDEDLKAALLRRSDRNIVAIDLPHVPPKTAGPDPVYAQAADLLKQWQRNRTLVREDAPAIYVCHQDFTEAGRRHTRKMFFARMRLEPFGAGTVFPHEQTFGGPKEDRLKLMQATRCQLSAVFGLYSDPAGVVDRLLDMGSRPPDVAAEMEGVTNRLWVVTDDAQVAAVLKPMAGQPVYIADGHHRYGTARLYLDELIATNPDLPRDHPARFVLMGFCAMEDAGCIILPTHRVLTGFDSDAEQKVWTGLLKGLETPQDVSGTDPDEVLPPDSAEDIALYRAADDNLYTARFSQRPVLEGLAADRSPAWRGLDLAYLHRYLVDELVTSEALRGAPPTIHYVKSARDAVQEARTNQGIALLCKPCTMAELRAVSEAGDLMPQKSTYFYPKLPTGLVLNPLQG